MTSDERRPDDEQEFKRSFSERFVDFVRREQEIRGSWMGFTPEQALTRESSEERVALAESLEFFRGRITEYAKNEDFEPELQRRFEKLDASTFDVDEKDYFDVFSEVLSTLSERILEALKDGRAPSEKNVNILADTIKHIDSFLIHAVNPERRLEIRFRKASILKGFLASQEESFQELQTRERHETPSQLFVETLETWLEEYGRIRELFPKIALSRRLNFEQARRWLFETNGSCYVGIIGEWLKYSRCRYTFGEKYAKFDNIERLFGREFATQEDARELSNFLNNPPESKASSEREREWALARLYDSLRRDFVFDRLQKSSDFVFNKRDLEERRDKHICSALNLWATELIGKVGRIEEFVDEGRQRSTEGFWQLNDRFVEEHLQKRMREGKRELLPLSFNRAVEGWSDPDDMSRSRDSSRNTALLLCYLTLDKTNEKLQERITATVGTTCLTSVEFEKALEGAITFKETLVKSQKKGGMLDCARAVVLLASRSSKVRAFVEKLVSETEWDPESENVKTEFYDCLNKLAGEDGLSYSQSLSAAMDRFLSIVDEFAKLPKEGEISEIADKYLNLFENLALSPWFDGESLLPDKLKECFAPLRDYDKTKHFEGKFRILWNFIEKAEEIKNAITRDEGSIISALCYLENLRILVLHVNAAVCHLCRATKPRVVLGDLKSVEVKKKNDSELIVRVPISNVSDEYSQSAWKARLKIKEDSLFSARLWESESQRIKPASDGVVPVAEILPCGRSVTAEFILRLLEPRDSFAINLQLEYDYVGEIDVRYDNLSLTDGKKTIVTPTPMKVLLPSEDEWFSYDIVVPGGKAAKKKHELTRGRLNALGGNGSVDYEAPGVEELLNNRCEQVDRAIEAFMVDSETDDGRTSRKFSSRGRLDIIYGQWRVGKTVILGLIEKKLRSSFPKAIVIRTSFSEVSEDVFGDDGDFESYLILNILQHLEDFLLDDPNERLVDLFREALASYHIDLYDYEQKKEWGQFCRFLKLFIGKIRKEDPNAALVLLLDEFTDIYPKILKGTVKEDFLRRWVQMIATTNLLCVVVGGEHTWDMMRTYGTNTGQKADALIFVDYLSYSDVEKFVRYVLYEAPEDNVASDDSYFSEETQKDVFDRIFKLTRGNPLLLRRLCEWVIDWLNESKIAFLTKTAVDDALDFYLENGSNIEDTESSLFSSLYDPFNEKEDGKNGELPEARRIEDDQVRDDNKLILDMIVELASRTNPLAHQCEYGELKEQCCKRGMDEETFKRRFTSLVSRNVVKHVDGAVTVFIDLFYEIKTRVERKRRNDFQ